MQRIAESLPPPKHKRSTDEVFSEPQRLHKVLASCGFGSRRAMEEMILAGRITVNRMPAEVGQKVGPGDEVRINGEVVKVRFAEPRPRVLMYHKPAGELVTRDDPEGRPTVFEKLPSIGNGRWINVGRLDYNTEGLLLFTNSGELANRLMHPRYEVEREYAVRVMGRLTDEQMQKLTTGIELDDGPARCEKVSDGGGDEDGSNHWYHVVLKEGRNREVRRIFEALGLMVSRLIRTRFGALAMPSTVKRGQIAELDAPEVDAIVASAGLRAQQPRVGGRPKGRHARNEHAKHLQGPRASRPHKQRPRGPRAPAASPGQGLPRADADGPINEAQAITQPRSGPHHPKKGRAWKNRGNGKANAGAPRPPHGDPRRKPAKPHAQGQRPPRARHNFDEVQPQSNANASPFGRTTLTVPGGAPNGFGNKASPRHRSGPRAQRAGKGNGQARNQGAPAFDRREMAEPVYKAPSRPTTQPQIRSKRTRTIVAADAAADANGSPALRRLLNEGKS
ncbi:MAG TPA: pseudouridine synthase [Casimicrobiaceae bacterium]